MITPKEDKETIRNILIDDKYIAEAGFKSDNIKANGASSDIISSNSPELQIFISMDTPERSTSDVVKNMVYNISVSGKRTLSNRVDEVVTQVLALLDRKNIGRGHILYLLDAPMELVSDPAIYIVETTFLCQSTNFNVVRR